MPRKPLVARRTAAANGWSVGGPNGHVVRADNSTDPPSEEGEESEVEEIDLDSYQKSLDKEHPQSHATHAEVESDAEKSRIQVNLDEFRTASERNHQEVL